MRYYRNFVILQTQSSFCGSKFNKPRIPWWSDSFKLYSAYSLLSLVSFYTGAREDNVAFTNGCYRHGRLLRLFFLLLLFICDTVKCIITLIKGQKTDAQMKIWHLWEIQHASPKAYTEIKLGIICSFRTGERWGEATSKYSTVQSYAVLHSLKFK